MENLRIWEEFALHACFMNYSATAIVKMLSKCDIYVDEGMVLRSFETNKKRVPVGITMTKTCVYTSLLSPRTVYYCSYMDASSIYALMRTLGYEITMSQIKSLIERFYKLEEIKNSMNGQPDPEYILQAYNLGFTVDEIWGDLKALGDRILKTNITGLSKTIENRLIKGNGFTKETVPTIRRTQGWNPFFERWIELTGELGLFSNYSVMQILASGYMQVSSKRINAILSNIEKRTKKSRSFNIYPHDSLEGRPKKPRLERGGALASYCRSSLIKKEEIDM